MDKKEKQIKLLEVDPYLQPFQYEIEMRIQRFKELKKRLLGKGSSFSSFANGSLYYGFHPTDSGWYYREWAPHAEQMHLIGDFNNWNRQSHPMEKLENGNWEIFIPGKDALPHQSKIKVQVTADGRTFDRIPLYIRRAVQDPQTMAFDGQIWNPEEQFVWTDQDFRIDKKTQPLIYECHIGMAGEECGVSTFRYFKEQVLPRIQKEGYNTLQIMAIMEHPYYASFGYQVTNFFAVSSRFGTPEELKELIDTAHSMGIAVLLDIVHSHAAENTMEGINEFDGTDYQFFHHGAKGNHPAWGTKLFDYSKPEVLHFLLSNVKFWLEEYHFDGFRFDGVTSMLYQDHGLGECFDCYDKYFSMNTDVDAIAYLQCANELTREVKSFAITIAEDMSGMPGMCIPVKDGGVGFDYRLSMGVPDFWVKTLTDRKDEDWDLGWMWHELTTRRPKEKNIGYCESHDQALVGDKTIMFRLADQEMYWHMDKASQSYIIDRAISLHKMIRLVTFSLAGEGYLNFMGNEFGHPEWIDFPREGNGNSYHYARRQWGLAENKALKYEYLLEFDRAMLELTKKKKLLGKDGAELLLMDQRSKILAYRKGDYIFCFNFHPYLDSMVEIPLQPKEKLDFVLDTEAQEFGGYQRPVSKTAITQKGPDGVLRIKTSLDHRRALVIAIKK